MTKKFAAILILALFGASSSALAIVVDYEPDDLTYMGAFPVANSGTASETKMVNDNLGLPEDCVLLMLGKFDNDNNDWEEEVLADFGTNFLGGGIGPLSGDPFSFSWNLAGSGFELFAVVGKQGNNDSDLYKVKDGARTSGTGMIYSPQSDQWSHLSFFGKRVSHDAPDSGATLILLGAALAGLGFLRRRR